MHNNTELNWGWNSPLCYFPFSQNPQPKLYDKHDDSDFHTVNFPFRSSNTPFGPSYGVYTSQLIRYARCCSHYDNLGYHHKRLVEQLLSQGYKDLWLKKPFKKISWPISRSH